MLSEEVKRYRELSGDNNPNTPISRIGGYLDGYEKAMEQTRWIPVSERLPEDDEDILITYKGNMGHPITSVSYYDGDFRTEDGEGYFSEVIAWMPLPTPYKAESED